MQLLWEPEIIHSLIGQKAFQPQNRGGNLKKIKKNAYFFSIFRFTNKKIELHCSLTKDFCSFYEIEQVSNKERKGLKDVQD